MWCMAIRMARSHCVISSPWRRLVHHDQNVSVFFPRFQAGNQELCILHALTSPRIPRFVVGKILLYLRAILCNIRVSKMSTTLYIRTSQLIRSFAMDLYHCFQPVHGNSDLTPRNQSPLQCCDRPSQKLANKYWQQQSRKRQRRGATITNCSGSMINSSIMTDTCTYIRTYIDLRSLLMTDPLHVHPLDHAVSHIESKSCPVRTRLQPKHYL